MKLKFLFRTAVDSWGIKNKKCSACLRLIVGGNLACNYRKKHFYKANFFNTCSDFKYLRVYKELK